MKDPRHLSIQDFTYFLPEERIAKYPLAERDASKLLVYKEGKIKTDTYRNISKYIPEDSVLVFNNTKVVEARLLFQKETGGIIEIFCLEPHEQYPDITTAMQQKEKVLWQCLVGGVSKWKPGLVLEKKIQTGKNEITLCARYIEKRADSFIIELSWTPDHIGFAELLHYAGAIPLPPYIKRSVEESDKERYQTVYAHAEGSVAAPTAGLHFTPKIFKELNNIHVVRDFVTLHVGAGTFKPVKSETMHEHIMHAEWIDVSKTTIENIFNDLEEPIVAVGTTSLRTIESLYWLGVKQFETRGLESGEGTKKMPELSQWEVYKPLKENISAGAALRALLDWMNENKLDRLIAKTQILIAPGYEFKIIKGLITNFHQPQSTLLLLVAALIGDDLPTGKAGWRKVYDYALQNDFRFLSYGDGCLLWLKSC
ncbi:MAG: S-adenosylmethionine:tRNA ribosyltransferase-isomerase [Chitinophagaceae bacterium]|nr:S-adenosylmethionine:tRNA ribosyltransferase-isomerase [Chitinophagaceae bacterium]